MKKLSVLQLTLAILKPDLMTNPVRLQVRTLTFKRLRTHDVIYIKSNIFYATSFWQSVKQKVLQENFWIVRWKVLQWQRKDAELFYEEHRGLSTHKVLYINNSKAIFVGIYDLPEVISL